jgi:hypothetical protein
MRRWRKRRTPEQIEAEKKYMAKWRDENRELTRLYAADYRRMAREEKEHG